jgi:putative MATE family efflux protein
MPRISNTARLGSEPVVKLLFRLSVPSIVGMVIQALYNVVDTIYVGHVSKHALSALSLAFPIQMVLIAIAVGTGVGTNSLISRMLGEKRNCRANNVAEHVLLLSFFFGAVMAVVGWFFSEDIVRWFTSDPRLIEPSGAYIRIIMLGSVTMFVPIITNNILRGEGNTFVPMITLMVGALINIGLDPFLIYGLGPFPEMGVAGAATATVIARALSGLFIVLVLLLGKHTVKFQFRFFRFSPKILGDIYRVGVPAMFMQLLASVMIAGMNRIVVEYNTLAVAVVGVFFRLQSFILMPIFGLNQGFIPIVGYNYGHRNPERMRGVIKTAMLIGFGFSMFGFLLFVLIPGLLVSMFNSDPELIRMGAAALRRIGIAFPIIGPAIVGIAVFQAVGKGLPSLVLTTLRQIVILLPLMYLLGRRWGLPTLWLSFPVAAGVSVALLFVWLRSTLKTIFSRLEAGPTHPSGS